MADNRRERFADLDITKDELNKIGDALKDKEFVNLLQDYYKEVTDPENIKTYQNEMIQLEKERGIDCTFINPEAGYVIKSSVDGNRKAFINVCYNENVGKPSNEPVRLENGQVGRNWQIPHLLSPPRDDFSKNDTKTTICTVYDVVFHPQTMHLAAKFPEFRKMVTNTALDSVENKFNIKLDRNNLKYPKMKFKGNVAGRNPVIRKRNDNFVKVDDDDILEQMYPHPFDKTETSKIEQKQKPEKAYTKNQDDQNSVYTTPKYSIKQLSEVDLQDYRYNMTCKFNATIPNELIVEIDLPLLNSTADTQLDVTEKSISLISEKPAKYKLQIQLPYCVNEDIGNAKFDKSKRRLIVTLPVKRKTEPVSMKFTREDSGVDSDQDSSISPPNELICELSSKENVPEDNVAEKETEILQSEGLEENVLVNSSAPIVETELRTNPFLDADKEYIFPEYTYNIYKNTLAFTLHVKNVDPISVVKQFITSGVQIKFSSISSGFYPVFYAFCVQFPVTFLQNDVTVETWDNNAIVQIPFEKDFVEKSFFVGLNDTVLEEVTLKSIVPNPKKVQTEELTVKTLYSDDEVTVEVTSSSLPQNIESKFTEMQIKEEDSRKKLEKMSSYSESSGDELSVSHSPLKSKGILKYKRSTSRTLNRSVSESSIDDMTWPNSLDNYQLGSDSCIPEEKEQCDNSFKKTVRFNDHVSKQIFRLNSSILGQKKKNQRKNRNKKRTQDRRHSESELSENEDKKDQFRKKPIFTNKDRQRPHSESELSETEHKDHYFIKKSALKNPMNKKDVNRQRLDSGVSSDTDNNKEQQKATHQIKSPTSNIEFQSDLIFDIDM